MACDGLPIASCDRAGELESVVDHASHEWVEGFGRRAGGFEERACRLAQGDEVVRGDGRAGVVGRTVGVFEVERMQAEGFGEPEAASTRLVRLGGDRRPGTVELLGPARLGERLERMHPEAPFVRVERSRAASRRSHARSTARERSLAATSAIARSGTQTSTSSGSAPSRSTPRSARRALTAEPTRPPAPTTRIRSIIGGSSSVSGYRAAGG